jgi:hypothetical protein
MHALYPVALAGMGQAGVRKWKRLSGVRFSCTITTTFLSCGGNCAKAVPETSTRNRDVTVSFISNSPWALIQKEREAPLVGQGKLANDGAKFVAFYAISLLHRLVYGHSGRAVDSGRTSDTERSLCGNRALGRSHLNSYRSDVTVVTSSCDSASHSLLRRGKQQTAKLA